MDHDAIHEKVRQTAEALRLAERRRVELERDLHVSMADEKTAWLAHGDAMHAQLEADQATQKLYADPLGGSMLGGVGGSLARPMSIREGLDRPDVRLADLRVGGLIQFRYGKGERIWGKIARVGETAIAVTLENQPVFEAGDKGDEVSIPCEAINDSAAQGFIFQMQIG